ncbi:uncharacterized protein LOC9638892 isoform X2 [Selaginella moellendorffii]|uniref:uncharacterized protein LOC9638892 isoform X2 n=1 Tax=Selaginella moellendorffii TaxID=88036 RepID=UPI000D1C2207|nr:uncharacterized protein LOC9638892 isoform X2 [Selaginella moellendorffii]|eukprot:XP_024518160.1 uncharacterized protein LOC9638892 isoform X2 [Selaginella moellendorffii]
MLLGSAANGNGIVVFKQFRSRQLLSGRISSCKIPSSHFSLSRSHLIRCEAASNAVSSVPGIEWVQRTFDLPPYKRGCHIITQQIYKAVPEIRNFRVGIAHIFVMHTSASLTINENASPDVPLDMEDALNKIAPEGHHYRHLDEGLDDMPAHVKSSIMGCSLSVPITAGRLNLGIWQGVWLNEHRDYGGSRRLCITIHGQC